jgi:hypothetical protein
VKNVALRDGSTWSRRPKLFDTSAPPQPIDVQPWGGTKMVVAFEVYAYDKPRKGIKLQPVAIQIVDLVEGQEGGDLDSFGFEEMELGFKHDGTADENFFTETQGQKICRISTGISFGLRRKSGTSVKNSWCAISL